MVDYARRADRHLGHRRKLKSKPIERLGRKATGPKGFTWAAEPPGIVVSFTVPVALPVAQFSMATEN